MIELMRLLGYDEGEIPTERPRLEKVFDKLGFTSEDIQQAKQRLHKYYSIELNGVRKIFRFIVREFVASLLTEEKGIKSTVYGFMSPGFEVISSAAMSKRDDISVIYHSWAFQIIVGCVFGKLEPFIDEAEKKWLKAGLVGHCANVKTILGPMLLGLFPKPDLFVTAGVLCELSPKNLDLLHESYNIPVVFFDTCQDRGMDEHYDGTLRTASFAARSLRKTVETVQEVIGCELSDDLLLTVQDAKGKLFRVLDKIQKFLMNTNPLTISPAHDNIMKCLIALGMTLDEITEATEAMNQFYAELTERASQGVGVVEKDAPRVLATLPMGQTDPRLEQLACEMGIAIVGADVMFPEPPIMDTNDPYLKLCLGRQQSLMTQPIARRIATIIEICESQRIEGLLDRYHVGCRIVAADAILIEKAVKKELGIPVMLLEWENFDPRVFKLEEYKKRFSVFKTMMLSRAG